MAYFVGMTLCMVVISTIISKFVTRRLPDAPALFHRFAYVPFMGIAALCVNENAGHFRGNDEASWAVLFPLVVMDWRWLTSPVRPARVMLLPTVFAGFVAVIAGLIFAGDEFPIAGAVCAVAALMVQVLCPFDPKASAELAATSDWIDTLNSVFVVRREEIQRRRQASAERLAKQMQKMPARSEPVATPSDGSSGSLAGSSSITLETPPTENASATAETIGLSGTPLESGYSSRGENEPSSRITALALAMLPFCTVGVLPFFGLHRFYVGKKVTGVLWLLTLGFFGIGQIIDALMIALGGFKDPQGRHLVSPFSADSGDQKVNPLSTLPSAESMVHTGMNLLGGLLLAFVIPAGFLLALDLPEMINAEIFREFGLDPGGFRQFFGDSRWTGHLWNVLATALCVLGLTALTLIALARRHCGFAHLFRVPVCGAAMVGAFCLVMETTSHFRWPEFGIAIDNGHIGRLLTLVFDENMFPAMVFGPLIVSVGLVFLSWPPKFRSLIAMPAPHRPIPQDAGQTPAEQEVS